jgi:hypothetical protein
VASDSRPAVKDMEGNQRALKLCRCLDQLQQHGSGGRHCWFGTDGQVEHADEQLFFALQGDRVALCRPWITAIKWIRTSAQGFRLAMHEVAAGLEDCGQTRAHN